MVNRPLLTRDVFACLLFASAVIVMGIAAYYQDYYRQIQVAAPEISLLVSVGAITALYEITWTVTRHLSNGLFSSFGVEIGVLFVIWVLWLSASIAFTISSKTARYTCDNFDRIIGAGRPGGSLAPGFASSASSYGCPTYYAVFAFMWIAFSFSTLIMIYTVYCAVSQRRSTGSLFGGSFKAGGLGNSRYASGSAHRRRSDATMVEAGTGNGAHVTKQPQQPAGTQE